MPITVGHSPTLPPWAAEAPDLQPIINGIQKAEESRLRRQDHQDLWSSRLSEAARRQAERLQFQAQQQDQRLGQQAQLQEQNWQNKFDFQFSHKDQMELAKLHREGQALDSLIAQQQQIIDDPTTDFRTKQAAWPRMQEYVKARDQNLVKQGSIKQSPVPRPPQIDPQAEVGEGKMHWDRAAGGWVPGPAGPDGGPELTREIRNGEVKWTRVDTDPDPAATEMKKIDAEIRANERKLQHEIKADQRRAQLNTYNDWVQGSVQYRNKLATMLDNSGMTPKPLYTPEQVDAMVKKMYPDRQPPSFDEPAPSSGQGVAAPKSKAEYDALPPGTKFVDPNGKTWVKP